MKTTILLADCHMQLRRSLREILSLDAEFEIVAEASSGQEAFAMADQFHPDVAIIDIGLRELDGIEATERILERYPATAVLILSVHSDNRYMTKARGAGARGYIVKNLAGEKLLEAVHSIRQGKPFFSTACGNE
jgi:DNA-binding NarL/FixJ family response regulator